MKQVWITKIGGPEVLQLREAPDPEVKTGEIRIRVKVSKVDDGNYVMAGTATLCGNYTWNKRKFTKVRKEGDNSNSWDIEWVRRGGAFVNTGGHYTGWKMVRPDPDEEKSKDP